MLEQLVATFKYVLENYGLQAALLLYFLARDFWRDWTQGKTIAALQTEMRGVILPLVEKNTSVVAANSVVLKDVREGLRETRSLIHDLRERIQVDEE